MKAQLKDHVSRHITKVPYECSVRECLEIMSNNWIRHLPVHDENQEI